MKNLVLPIVDRTWDFHGFEAYTTGLLQEGKTTGTNHSPDYLDYTTLNLQRSNRVYKTSEIGEALAQAIQNLQRSYVWMVIVEAWCGDVPQNLPVFAKAAELTDKIKLEVVLRDENPEIMNHFLTNGGKAVPILVVMDASTRTVITHWGPRPAPAQQMVMDYKALTEKPPYTEFVKKVQLWYAHDHTQTLQAELLALVQGLEA